MRRAPSDTTGDLGGADPALPEAADRAGGSRPTIQSHVALRGIAALLVVFYHLQFGGGYRLPPETQTAFFSKCYLLVDLFFILSGFVISYSSGFDQFARRPRASALTFYAHRVARIYPLHLFCLSYAFLLLGSLVVAHGMLNGSLDIRELHLASLVEEVLLIQSWIPGAPYWNVPSWSISAEAFAYLLFPWLAILACRWPRATGLSLIGVPAAFYSYVATTSGSLDIVAGLAPIRCLSGFVIGMYIFRYRHSATLLPTGSKSLVQLLSCLALIATMATGISDLLCIPLFAILIHTTWQDQGLLPSLLKHRSLRYLGEVSYSVYLNHVCVILVADQLWVRVMAGSTATPAVLRAAQITIYVTAILVLSHFTYRYVELPGKRSVLQMLGVSRSRSSSHIAA